VRVEAFFTLTLSLYRKSKYPSFYTMHSILTTLLMSAVTLGMTSAQLPNCTDVGVSLCFDSNGDDLCDDYCRTEGSRNSVCEVFDNSLRVTCQCTAPDKGCLDVPEYNSSNIPTCVSTLQFFWPSHQFIIKTHPRVKSPHRYVAFYAPFYLSNE
jgi:hypothetical protein